MIEVGSALLLALLTTTHAPGVSPYWSVGPSVATGQIGGGIAGGLSCDAAVGAPWLPEVRAGVGTFIHRGYRQSDGASTALPMAVLEMELSYVFQPWGELSFGPAAHFDLLSATDSEQRCVEIGGCLYPESVGGLGVFVRYGVVDSSRSRLHISLGYSAGCIYDMCGYSPRVRAAVYHKGFRISGRTSGHDSVIFEVGADFSGPL